MLLVVDVVGVELMLQVLGLMVLAALTGAALRYERSVSHTGPQGCLALLLNKVHLLEYAALLLRRVDKPDLGLLVEAEGLL